MSVYSENGSRIDSRTGDLLLLKPASEETDVSELYIASGKGYEEGSPALAR